MLLLYKLNKCNVAVSENDAFLARSKYKCCKSLKSTHKTECTNVQCKCTAQYHEVVNR